ncbi:hypothetical protein C3B78_00285 [Arthrobacter sp. PGP41]|uniref:hypothetical protein n=1 Tax=Arthrobacter sp. PGP41 TaxID=2079227 RepID=UPI000CDCB498|nr:hypothetical protein [Arthrobacter sp. PGP41]AUZ33081.1 hypothetical protein C3B78_00285 [Arthrobacter sp. PGP41]
MLLDGTMFVDDEDPSEVEFFDSLTKGSGPRLAFCSIEDAGDAFTSPTVITSTDVIVGHVAIQSYFKR